MAIIVFCLGVIATNWWTCFGCAVAGIWLIGGMLSPHFQTARMLEPAIGKVLIFSGVVAEDPDTSDSKTTLRLTDLQTENGRRLTGTIFVQLSKNTVIQRSDKLTVSGKLSEGFGVFVGSMRRPRIMHLARGGPGDIPLVVRNWFTKRVKTFVPEPAVSLGLGYLLGLRSSLPANLVETLKIVGLTHIVVASGANLSILITFARKFLGKISRFAGFFGSTLLVLGFVGVVGMTSSMTRAGIVSLLSLLAWYFGRQTNAGKLLLLVAAETLLINPMFIIDLGWLLSFGSFAGIMILGPILTEVFFGTEKPRMLAATLLETVSASLLCTPILLYFFGSLSLISLLANLLVLPTISIVMALSFATGVVAFWPWLANVLGWGAELVLKYHLAVIDFFGQQKLFLFKMPAGELWVFGLYLPILVFFAIILYSKKMLINNALEMVALGRELGEKIQTPAVIELIGDVGAGKTTFVQGLAQGLDIEEAITSPSFTIAKTYFAGEKRLVHYDFYRLSEPGLMTEDLEESVCDPNTITVVEWAETIGAVLPANRLKIQISMEENGARRVKMSGPRSAGPAKKEKK